MSIKGNLRDVSSSQLLNLISLARKSGILSISSRLSVTLAFREGSLIHASWDNNVNDLAQILWHYGQLTHKQMHAVQTNTQGSSERQIGRLLIQAGYFTYNQIKKCIRLHALDIVRELLTWTEGDFHFLDNEFPSLDRILVNIRLDSMLRDGERHLMEWERLQKELPDLSIYLRCTEHPKTRLDQIRLTLREWRVVAGSNANTTVKQIAQANKLSAYQIRRIVYGLLQIGLVEIVPPAHPSPASFQSTAAFST